MAGEANNQESSVGSGEHEIPGRDPGSHVQLEHASHTIPTISKQNKSPSEATKMNSIKTENKVIRGHDW